jgi:hypothetical protein
MVGFMSTILYNPICHTSNGKAIVINGNMLTVIMVMIFYKGADNMLKLLQGFILGLLCFTIPLTIYVVNTGGL